MVSSGMPERSVFISMTPVADALSTTPFGDMSSDTDSTMSRYTSFFLYVRFGERHCTAPVTCIDTSFALRWFSYVAVGSSAARSAR